MTKTLTELSARSLTIVVLLGTAKFLFLYREEHLHLQDD